MILWNCQTNCDSKRQGEKKMFLSERDTYEIAIFIRIFDHSLVRCHIKHIVNRIHYILTICLTFMWICLIRFILPDIHFLFLICIVFELTWAESYSELLWLSFCRSACKLHTFHLIHNHCRTISTKLERNKESLGKGDS